MSANAARCSSSAPAAIAGSAIAASPADSRRGYGSDAWPIGGTSKAWRDGWIIATASSGTARAAAAHA